MDAGNQWWPDGLQFLCQRRQLRPGDLGAGQIGGGEGVLFKRNEMQAAAGLRVVSPGLPGGEKVQPEAETGFEDDETVAVLPALRQVVTGNEDMPRLRQAAVHRVINIVEQGRAGRAVGAEFEAGRLEDFRHGVSAAVWTGRCRAPPPGAVPGAGSRAPVPSRPVRWQRAAWRRGLAAVRR